jgi:hypothetical protein
MVFLRNISVDTLHKGNTEDNNNNNNNNNNKHKGATDNNHTGHCTHTSKSTNVKVQNVCLGKNITCSTSLNSQHCCNITFPRGIIYSKYGIVNTLCKDVKE